MSDTATIERGRAKRAKRTATVTVKKTITILRTEADVLAAFRRWIARPPDVEPLEWDCEVVQEQEPERISWRLSEGGEIRGSGSAEVRPAPPGRGTELTVQITYTPPAGQAGKTVLKLMGKEPGQQMARDLYRLRQLLEAGVLATTDGQPSGRKEK
jgi:uncharacterized membrane protein